MIYLDNAASTQVHEEVIKEMIPYFKEQYGNPSSIHRYGRIASKAVQNAKKKIADLINADASEILITSGGTESNNTALLGIAHKSDGKHIITSSIEHEAILEPCKRLEKEGFQVTYLPVDREGLVRLEDIRNAISSDTCLISIMYANNEVGTIQPIKEIADIANKKEIIFHTDAVQAAGKIPIDVNDCKVDLLSISSHKINGPKGVGALYIKKGTVIDPFILGGGQENGLRSGTENVASIVGFGKACELAKHNMKKNQEHLRMLRDRLVSRLLEIPHVTLNGHPAKRIPNNANFTFLGTSGEDLIIKLDENGVAASTGSACSVKMQKASHVLKAMGLSHEQISGSLRLTVGLSNNEKEIDDTVKILKKIVKELRDVSPYKEKYDF
ncbi:MAG: cysteine desulfurase family protein [Nitrosopumilaceae archaeon]